MTTHWVLYKARVQQQPVGNKYRSADGPSASSPRTRLRPAVQKEFHRLRRALGRRDVERLCCARGMEGCEGAVRNTLMGLVRSAWGNSLHNHPQSRCRSSRGANRIRAESVKQIPPPTPTHRPRVVVPDVHVVAAVEDPPHAAHLRALGRAAECAHRLERALVAHRLHRLVGAVWVGRVRWVGAWDESFSLSPIELAT